MRLLFFDMEFADGRVPGSIYSFGYVVTDEKFRIIEGPEDILINPESSWNDYVVHKILAYPKKAVEAAPAFPAVEKRLRKLFEKCDMAVGFAVMNDVNALRHDCERYKIAQFCYRHVDMEKICRAMEEHKDAHGLAGFVTAWCGKQPKNQHRSDGDALATMHLLQAICNAKHVTPDMMAEAFPDAVGQFGTPAKQNFFRRLFAKFRK